MNTVEGEMRMIPDGPERFKGSCVTYVWFNDYRLRAMFARHREREQILQEELKEARDRKAWKRYESRLERLQEVEAMLIFMATNLDPKAEATYRRRRRNV